MTAMPVSVLSSLEDMCNSTSCIPTTTVTAKKQALDAVNPRPVKGAGAGADELPYLVQQELCHPENRINASSEEEGWP